MSEQYIVSPTSRIFGKVYVPGDKSISHRSLILLSISEGISKISGLLESDDCISTLNICQLLGVDIIKQSNGDYSVKGKGLFGLKEPKRNLDCGNSGTSMRLLAGLLCGQKFSSCLIGDESLTKRPMERILIPLQLMGGKIHLSKNNTAPINIDAAQKISPIIYQMPIDSAQIKSSIILASLYAKKTTKVIENNATRDHTENMINFLGGNIETENKIITINPCEKLISKDIKIPGDISSAMFIIVGCLISEKSEVTICNVGLNKFRTGALEILKMMGAKIEIKNVNNIGPEITGDIFVYSSKLKGISIPSKYVASAIDEFPIIFIAAASASGKTVLKNAEELKYKESNRLEVMSKGLKKCGIANDLYDDGIEITGGNFEGGLVDSCGDHRVAMSFAIAGIVSKKDIHILNTDNVSTSFPAFYNLVKKMGLNIKRVKS